MFSRNPHGILYLIEYNPTPARMINNFPIRIVPQIVPGIIASITIDVLDFEVSSWRVFHAYWWVLVVGGHVVYRFYPAWGRTGLLALGLLYFELICVLLVYGLLLWLLWSLLGET